MLRQPRLTPSQFYHPLPPPLPFSLQMVLHEQTHVVLFIESHFQLAPAIECTTGPPPPALDTSASGLLDSAIFFRCCFHSVFRRFSSNRQVFHRRLTTLAIDCTTGASPPALHHRCRRH
ncbi:hypothetical protein LXL04_031076 [Taraxacum kok-saghyz]